MNTRLVDILVLTLNMFPKELTFPDAVATLPGRGNNKGGFWAPVGNWVTLFFSSYTGDGIWEFVLPQMRKLKVERGK